MGAIWRKKGGEEGGMRGKREGEGKERRGGCGQGGGRRKKEGKGRESKGR